MSEHLAVATAHAVAEQATDDGADTGAVRLAPGRDSERGAQRAAHLGSTIIAQLSDVGISR